MVVSDPKQQARVWKPEKDEENKESKLISKMKKDPFIPAGVLGSLGVIGYSIYAYKNRGPAMNLNRYLMRLRVMAQSSIVGAIILGIAWQSINKKPEEKKPQSNMIKLLVYFNGMV